GRGPPARARGGTAQGRGLDLHLLGRERVPGPGPAERIADVVGGIGSGTAARVKRVFGSAMRGALALPDLQPGGGPGAQRSTLRVRSGLRAASVAEERPAPRA